MRRPRTVAATAALLMLLGHPAATAAPAETTSPTTTTTTPAARPTVHAAEEDDAAQAPATGPTQPTPSPAAEPTASATPSTPPPSRGDGAADSAPTSTGASPSSTPTRTPVEPSRSPHPTTASDADPMPPRTTDRSETDAAARNGDGESDGGLSIRVAAPVVDHPVQRPGALVPLSTTVETTDTRPLPGGWKVSVQVSSAVGTGGRTFVPGPESYYQARDADCTTSTGRRMLGADPVTVQEAAADCASARWHADLGIAVPAQTQPGNYRLTVTHSVY